MSAGEILFIGCTICCLAGEIAIIRSAIKTSRLPLPEGASHFGEIAWSILPAIAITALLTATYSAVRVAP